VADPVTAIVRRALALVEQQRLDVYRAIASALTGLRLDLALDGPLCLVSTGVRLVECAPDPARRGDLRVRAERPAIQALLRGDTTLLRALRDGTVHIAGTTSVLARALTAFELLVGALLRIADAHDLRLALEHTHAC
jgi:hypothetical protein